MKFKFVTYVSTAAVLPGLLIASQPAFAITSLADNKSSALEVLLDNQYRWKLQTAADEEWFLWTLLSKLKIMAKEELTLD
ncbi:hypothetical protein [Bacillus spizizenii]|uniref:hypothetical protein n=1 Tax=Bacillus spizizenii TaxID=96241 RepID=UPI002DB6C755|nr:hypothetical protein [Bacillus spizizenii]MEC1436222.1 hypothetical protein [Bacillus spizizenii]